MRNKIQKKIQTKLKKLGSIRISCSYFVMSSPDYDPEEGISIQGETVSYPDIEIVFDEFSTNRSASQISFNDEADVLSIDRILIVAALDLPVKPRINDVVVDVDSVSWRIKAIGGDPADSCWFLHGRPFNE